MFVVETPSGDPEPLIFSLGKDPNNPKDIERLDDNAHVRLPMYSIVEIPEGQYGIFYNDAKKGQCLLFCISLEK